MKIANLFLAALFAATPVFGQAAEVVFAGNSDGQYDLYHADLTTSKTRRLTETTSAELMPAVSPDGLRLAFVSDRAGANSLYMMSLTENASGAKDISAGVGAYANPGFSLDGNKIAAQYSPDPQNLFLNTQIVILDLNTLQQTVLIDSTKLKTSENSEATVVVDRPVWISENLLAYIIAEYADPEVGRLTKSTIYMYDLKKNEQVRVAGGESYFGSDGRPMGFKAALPTVITENDHSRSLIFTAIRGGTDREPVKMALSGGGKGIVELNDPEFFGPVMLVDDLWIYGIIDEEGNPGLAWRSSDLKTVRNKFLFSGKIINPASVR